MQVNGQDAKRIASEQKIQMRKTGEALDKLLRSPEWKYVNQYLEQRQTTLVNAILAPTTGGDGMSIALSAERNKGALQEIRTLFTTFAGILNEYHEDRKSREPREDEIPKTAPAPGTEADAAKTMQE